MSIVEWLDHKFYPQFNRNWDDQLFRARIISRLNSDSVILDLGAGAGIVKEMNFRGMAARICGVDLDPRVVHNPMLDEGKVGDAGVIPYPDNQFDLVFADNVVEHLDDPEAVFSEVTRVLKPGGIFLFKTPNSTHYMPLIARSTPHWFHQYFNRRRGRLETDTFPTRYRANSVRAVTSVAARSGLAVAYIETIEGRPEYLRISWPSYIVGIVYERLVNATSALARFRILLVAELRKEAN